MRGCVHGHCRAGVGVQLSHVSYRTVHALSTTCCAAAMWSRVPHWRGVPTEPVTPGPCRLPPALPVDPRETLTHTRTARPRPYRSPPGARPWPSRVAVRPPPRRPALRGPSAWRRRWPAGGRRIRRGVRLGVRRGTWLAGGGKGPRGRGGARGAGGQQGQEGPSQTIPHPSWRHATILSQILVGGICHRSPSALPAGRQHLWHAQDFIYKPNYVYSLTFGAGRRLRARAATTPHTQSRATQSRATQPRALASCCGPCPNLQHREGCDHHIRQPNGVPWTFYTGLAHLQAGCVDRRVDRPRQRCLHLGSRAQV